MALMDGNLRLAFCGPCCFCLSFFAGCAPIQGSGVRICAGGGGPVVLGPGCGWIEIPAFAGMTGWASAVRGFGVRVAVGLRFQLSLE